MEPSSEGETGLIQSEGCKRLRVDGCLYWVNRRPHAVGYACDSVEVSLLRVKGTAPDIGALLPALTRVGSEVLSLIGQRCGWDERNECMSS